jgi:hypothetical protein
MSSGRSPRSCDPSWDPPALLLSPGKLPLLTVGQLLTRLRYHAASSQMGRSPVCAARAAQQTAALARFMKAAISRRASSGGRLRRLPGATGEPSLADVRFTLDLVAHREIVAFTAPVSHASRTRPAAPLTRPAQLPVGPEIVAFSKAMTRLIAFCHIVRGAEPAMLTGPAVPLPRLRKAFVSARGAVVFCLRGDEAAARDAAVALIGRFPGMEVACIAAKDAETFWRETRRWRAEHEGFVDAGGAP